MAFISNLALAFDEVVAKHAARPALFYPESGSRTTYAELDKLALAIASSLFRSGIRQGDVVAIFHDKSPAAFAIILACLRLGVTYTNLDPESPWERLRKILVSCRPHAVVNSFPELPNLDQFSTGEFGEVLSLQSLCSTEAGPTTNLPDPRGIAGTTPSYIMFTSGSTGQPKGAVMSHTNVLSFIAWGQDRFGIEPSDVFTNVNPIYFDNSVFDFYTAIFSGATLVPLTPAQAKDPRLTVRLVGEAGCTIWFSVPSLLVYLLTTRALTPQSLPAIRKIIFGGEGFPKAKLKQLYNLFGSRADLENVYGPTECTCICAAHTIEPQDFEDMQGLATLGHLSQNFSGEILPLDESDPGFGELLLLGPHVGLGYYNDPNRTAQAFVQNPRHALYRDIGYHTGDLVRRDESGRLHFKGRADFQIKHMGYRIELEEIEAALGTLSGVKECAAIYLKIGEGMGQILGFVAMDEPSESDSLVARVAQIVPPYMVPKKISVLPSLPKNANGKIDRQILLKNHTA